MIRIDINIFSILSYLGFLYLISNCFLSSLSGFAWFLDWGSRINVNDSFINLFNFFWTTLLYLPSFFFILGFLTFSYKPSNNVPYYTVLYVLLLFIYNSELTDFLILNNSLQNNNLNFTIVNLLLTNNLNKYHPFIFYVSVWLFWSSWFFTSFRQTTTPLFNDSFITTTLNRTWKGATLWNVVALFLGSWWALQEGTWGGWWNWDPSEVLGLLFMIIGVIFIHSIPQPQYWLLQQKKLILLLFFTLFSYVFIQLNFDLVSHNFGSKFFFFFNHNLFFFEIIIVWLYATWYLLKTSYFTSSTWLNIIPLVYNSFSKPLHLLWYAVILIYALLIVMIIISFIPLLNYFLWTYLHINSFNTQVNMEQIILLFLFVLYLPFYSILNLHLFLLLIIGFYAFNSTSLVFLPLLVFRKTKTTIFHIGLILFLNINLTSYDVPFLTWDTINGSSDYQYNQSLYWTSSPLYTCNNFFLEFINLTYQDVEYVFNSWNIIYKGNTAMLNTFTLAYNEGVYYNLYILSINWLTSCLLIETNYLNNLLETFLIGFFLYWKFFISTSKTSFFDKNKSSEY